MPRIRVMLALLLVAGAAASAASGAPVVNSVTGVVQHKGVVTISGSAFGGKAVAAPYRWDDFDYGTVGSTLRSESNGGWTLDASMVGDEPRYSTAQVRWPGAKSAYQNFTGGNYNSTISLTHYPPGPLYFSGWFYMTVSGAASRNSKLLQLRAGDLDAITWECRVDQYPINPSGQQYVADCNGQETKASWVIGGNLHADGQWHRLEFYLSQGTVGVSDGVWSVWLDGRLVTELTGTFMTSNCPFDHFYLSHYYASDQGTPQPQAQRWWDELYVDNTRARVEIGDASTWAACTHREIQVPSAWTASAITCTVNEGTFTAGQQAWLYVVDSSGTANAQGYPITFTGGGGGDNPPTVSIVSPVPSGVYTTTTGQVTVSGTAADDHGLTLISWSNSLGGGGQATNSSGNWTAWTFNAGPLTLGDNVITVLGTDTAGQSGAATITLRYDLGPPGQPGKPVAQ